MLEEQKLENLRALMGDGRLVNLTVEGHETDTLAGHAEMLTGYPNFLTNVRSDSNYAPIPKGYMIFERLEAYYERDNIATIFVTGKSKLGAYEGSPFSNLPPALDVFDAGDRNASIVGEKAINYLERFGSKRIFEFVHFAEPDVIGHIFGEGSKEYQEAIKLDDVWLGKIIRTLKNLGIYKNTKVYLTTDHGFNAHSFGHPSAPDIFLAANDRAVKYQGSQVDIVPTLLARLGINSCLISTLQLTPPLSGRSLVDDFGIPCFVIVGGPGIFIAFFVTITVKRWRRKRTTPLEHVE
jgi:hypothetical protein